MNRENYAKIKRLEDYLARIKIDDRHALASLYEEVRVSVYSFALSIVKNRVDAEDILHEVIIKVYENVNGYSANGKPMAWILTITKNLSLMRIRSYKKIAEADDYTWDNLTKEETLSKEEKMVLKASLEILKEEERQIITLYAVSGLKHREIAHILELPLATVLSKYHRALKKMKSYLLEGENNEK